MMDKENQDTYNSLSKQARKNLDLLPKYQKQLILQEIKEEEEEDQEEIYENLPRSKKNELDDMNALRRKEKLYEIQQALKEQEILQEQFESLPEDEKKHTKNLRA